MKRLVSLALCLIMALAMLAGCSSNEETTAADTTTADTTTASTEASTEGKVEAVEKTKVYVTPEWVNSVIQGEQPESENYVIIHTAWGEVDDSSDYAKSHIPGAVHMNTDYIEEEVYWNIRTGEEITQVMKDYGITKDTTVICYGSGSNRVAFVCLWAGVENVKLLDGNFEAWEKAGLETEKGIVEPTPTEEDFGVEIPAHPEYVYSIDEVQDKLENDDNFRLVSIRSWEEFIGETSGYGYIPQAGEPKGAIWGKDSGDYEDENGIAVESDTVAKYLAEFDATLDNDLAFYCGTGWRATTPFLILYEEGYTNIHLYDGGWHQWVMDESRPVQVGDPRTDDCQYMTVGEMSTDKAE